ncbi:MAG: hypothetical protein ACK5LC_10645 [Coprobacillaceae bacterium]
MRIKEMKRNNKIKSGILIVIFSIFCFSFSLYLNDGIIAFGSLLFGVYSLFFGLYILYRSSKKVNEYIRSFFKVFFLGDHFYYEVKEEEENKP